MSEGSHAEKLGFRVGDVIESLKGEHISTTLEVGALLICLASSKMEINYNCVTFYYSVNFFYLLLPLLAREHVAE